MKSFLTWFSIVMIICTSWPLWGLWCVVLFYVLVAFPKTKDNDE